jgi:hypothetical protein
MFGYQSNFSPSQGIFQPSISKHAKPQKRDGHFLGEEDARNAWRQMGEAVAQVSNHQVLECRWGLFR